MEAHADTWQHCNSMLYTHNWWHIALYYLAQGAFQTVLQLYDVHIWGQARKVSPKDQVGAIATLLRLELRGIDVGARWQDLSRYLEPRLHEHCLPFQDLHYIYALARTGQTAQVTEMFESMRDHTQSLDSSGYAAWQQVAIPVARALIAYATGDWLAAIAHFKPVLHRLPEIGGSHTQRQLFRQIYWDASQKQQNRCVVYDFSRQRSTLLNRQLHRSTSIAAANYPIPAIETAASISAKT
jgi:hypothetical protein